MKKIDILDSTLRDGMQSEGISFSLEDKYKIAAALGKLGVSYIEAGNPASNPKDADFFNMDRSALNNAHLCAFGSTRRKFIKAEEDENLLSLLHANTRTVSIFGKASAFHVDEVLRTTRGENLSMIYDTVSFLKRHNKTVIFDAEHFFDGYRDDPAYAMSCLNAAETAGADVLCLCDTNGGTYFTDIYDIVKSVCASTEKQVGIHCHNDMGLAVANTLAAVDAGATHIQGTFLGFGERCGNANLSTIIPTLQLKRGYYCIPEDSMKHITKTAHKIAEISNVILSNSKPYVGYGAFAHKGGMHIDGVSKNPRSFEHIAPEAVGNRRRFILSEMSGRTSMLSKIRTVDPSLTRESPEVDAIMHRLKQMEYEGYQFEAAEESFELFVRRMLKKNLQFFKLDFFRIIGEQPRVGDNPTFAIIKINVNGDHELASAEGLGPVHALDIALKKALLRFYPTLANVRLTDYKVRVLESGATTAAKVRVLIESTDGNNKWTTVGVSADIIEASFFALTDSMEYKLMLDHAE